MRRHDVLKDQSKPSYINSMNSIVPKAPSSSSRQQDETSSGDGPWLHVVGRGQLQMVRGRGESIMTLASCWRIRLRVSIRRGFGVFIISKIVSRFWVMSTVQRFILIIYVARVIVVQGPNALKAPFDLVWFPDPVWGLCLC